ncbi:hypothetical protein EZS27_042783, partial [termite gut metagenome]
MDLFFVFRILKVISLNRVRL